jgi:glycosyltransferase involved in cell wall biosynthesis
LRALHVFLTYPGESNEGAAIYAHGLTRALAARGVEVDVLTTRARRLRMKRLFHIDWPAELPAREVVDGVAISRFRALRAPDRVGALANRIALRAWRKTEAQLGEAHARRSPVELITAAQRWGRGADLVARLGRGPVAPGLLGAVARRAPRRDVVLAGHAPFGLMGWVEAAARRAEAPVVLLPFIHEDDPFHHLPSLQRTYARAGAVLTLSPHTAELLRRHLPASNPVAVGAGVEVDVFDSPEVSGERFRAAHKLGGRRLLLFVGRKEGGKRYDLALRALDGLGENGALVIVGRDVDGGPLPRGVLHLEHLEPRDLADAYDACELLLHPSEHESFGMVCLEAWLRRKPVIGNARCGASAALIEHGKDGLLCASEADWPAATRELLGDVRRARRMGEAGREKTLAQFTWDRVAERTLAVYRELCPRAG